MGQKSEARKWRGREGKSERRVEWWVRVGAFPRMHTPVQREGWGDPALWRSALDALPNSSSWACNWQLCESCCCLISSAVTGNLMTRTQINSTAPEWFITQIKHGSYSCQGVTNPWVYPEFLHTTVLLFQKHADMTLKSNPVHEISDRYHRSIWRYVCSQGAFVSQTVHALKCKQRFGWV